MQTLGKFVKAYRAQNDVNNVVLECENEKFLQFLEENREKSLFISAEQYEEKRSNQANRYMWKLCDMIAQKLGTTKDMVYRMKLEDYGVFSDILVRDDAFNDTLSILHTNFKFIRELSCDGEYHELRLYSGSSTYNTKQMSRLLRGIVEDARELGIETWDDYEINMMIKAWRG